MGSSKSRISSPHFTAKRLALLGTMTTLASVGRVFFAVPFLPNVQPLTVLLLLVTFELGTVDGVIVAALSMVLTNLLLGMGPWTVHQVATYTILMILTGFLRPLYRREGALSYIVLAAYAGVVGWLYGFIISIFSVRFYGLPNFWVYYLNGLPFDTFHAVGNIGFYLLLEPLLRPLMARKFGDLRAS